MGRVGETCGVQPEGIDPAVVRAQLDRVLASAEIRNSRRCQLFLSHVVEATLEGGADQLKERTIGIAVFGRAPDYNTNEDTVVRHAAIEVRKRLAQYYQSPGRELEPRIVLPPGGYVPEFQDAVPRPESAPLEAARSRPRRWLAWRIAAAALAALVLTAIGWRYHTSRGGDLDRFWAPFLDDPADVVVCVGQPSRVYRFTGPRATELHDELVGTADAPPRARDDLARIPLTLGDIAPIGQRFTYLGDALCVSQVAAVLARRGKSFQIRGEAMTPFQDLRGKPAVLIGLANNQWTPRLTTELRFYIENNFEAGHYELRDRALPGVVIGIAENDRVDYAVVNRVFDASTEKPVMSAAGSTHLGTQAAGDFVSNEAYMREAFRRAPRRWDQQNIQVVLRTKIIGGMAGPPEVVALHCWGKSPAPAPIRTGLTPPSH